MANYPKSINVKEVTTKFGNIYKIGIKKTFFQDNNVENDWFNIDLLFSKKDNKPYFVINDWKPENKDEKTVTKQDVINEFDGEEIPY